MKSNITLVPPIHTGKIDKLTFTNQESKKFTFTNIEDIKIIMTDEVIDKIVDPIDLINTKLLNTKITVSFEINTCNDEHLIIEEKAKPPAE
jgi:hypothetical protein